MLKKEASGGAAVTGSASLLGCGDPPTTKPTGHCNGGSLMLSSRSLPSLFSTDAPMSRTSMAEQSKNSPCSSPRNGSTDRSASSHCGGIRSPAAGLAGVLVTGEADGEGYGENGRMILGIRLRVQLLPSARKGLGDLPSSPIEFGVKNRDAQLALLSPVQLSPLSSAAARAARRSEVEKLDEEDYTCVIAQGAIPKMTHIFEDRVVESRAGAGGDKDGGVDACCLLSSCCGCKNRLGQDKDAPLLRR